MMSYHSKSRVLHISIVKNHTLHTDQSNFTIKNNIKITAYCPVAVCLASVYSLINMGLFSSTHMLIVYLILEIMSKKTCKSARAFMCCEKSSKCKWCLSKISSPHTSRWNKSVTFTLVAAGTSISAFFSVLAIT